MKIFWLSGKIEERPLPATKRLESLQLLVGGYIEPISLPNGEIMWVNEEGRLKGLPPNPTATEYCDQFADRGRILPLSLVGVCVLTTKEEDL